jgi:nitroreductase
MLKDLVQQNRSCRRFYQDIPIEREKLRELVDLARLSASGANRQPLKYVLSCEPQENALIFPCLSWAGQLRDWPGPSEGERPSAYIVIVGDTEISGNFFCDHGIAAQSIMLGAREGGLGGCIHGMEGYAEGSRKLRQALNIPSRYEILLVLSLGKPKEKAVIEEASSGDSTNYWRDGDGVHHVPKRRLDDIIVES